jgi:hypothetical protein
VYERAMEGEEREYHQTMRDAVSEREAGAGDQVDGLG